MKAGDIVLIDLIQADGIFKLRPALLLKQFPKYNDFLVCGISSQVNQFLEGYDHILLDEDAHFKSTGLRKTSLIRLFFLAVVQHQRIGGTIGHIPEQLHRDLLSRLSKFIVS